jgi:hypothetical protein
MQQMFVSATYPIRCVRCNCDLIKLGIFVDGSTALGWQYLCEECHKTHGYGFGKGIAIRYQLMDDHRWIRTKEGPLPKQKRLVIESKPNRIVIKIGLN